MLLRLTLISFLALHGSCMEMRETVERMVMVRTTGSDLQPEATGYIYKKKNDGEESVIEMGESEVMEHLTKLYEQPQAFAAPIPVAAGPFYNKDDDAKNAGTKSDEHVIPVVEITDDRIDGVADVDYKKIFEEYAANFGDSKAFKDYLHGLGDYKGLYDQYKEGHDDNKGYKGYNDHLYGKGASGDDAEKIYKTHSVYGKSGYKKHHGDADNHDKYYDNEYKHDGNDKEHKYPENKEEGSGDIHKQYNDEKIHDFYDDKSDKDGYNKYTRSHEYHGSDSEGHEKGGPHEAAHQTYLGKDEHHDKSSEEEHRPNYSKEEDSSREHHESFGSKNGPAEGNSYGFKIKH